MQAVRNLMADVNIPKSLREVGVKKEAFEVMAKDSMASGIHATTPRKVSYEDTMAIYQAAY